MPADVCFEREEREASFILRGKTVPEGMPTVNEVVSSIAGCGGFLMRKGDGDPGAQTLWRGLTKVRAFMQGRRY